METSKGAQGAEEATEETEAEYRQHGNEYGVSEHRQYGLADELGAERFDGPGGSDAGSIPPAPLMVV